MSNTGPSPMTRLEAIRSRLKNATPGSWREEGDGDVKYIRVPPRYTIASFVSEANAPLIAHAPDDLRLLLACVDEMRGALRLLEQLTAEGSTQVRTVTAAQLNAHTRNAIASIEEKLR